MPSPIIFLDFDGVLIGDDFRPTVPVRHLDPSRVKILDQLVRLTDAKIVLSTSWRNPAGLTTEILNVLARDGLSVLGCVLGQTRYLESRTTEIGEWLITHDHPKNVCILDDLPIEGCLKRYQIQTDPKIGLTAQDALDAACLLLGVREESVV